VKLFSAQNNSNTASRAGRTGLSRRRNKPGLTLIELLIVMVISVLVLGAAVTLYQVNARVYVQQDAMLEQNQNLRVAMYTVARDVRMAGNSFPLLGSDITHIQVAVDGDWFQHEGSSTYGVRAIFGTDGGSDDTDTLTVFRADVESGSPVGQLKDDVALSGSLGSITLQEKYLYNTLQAGDIIALVDGNRAAILQVSTDPDDFPKKDHSGTVTGATDVITLGDTRFVPGGSIPNFPDFTAGTYVYNLRNVTFVTYSVDDNYNLVADYHDSSITEYDSGQTVIVATNIEDFQVRYILNGETIGPLQGSDGLDESRLDSDNWVVAVNLAMVSRSAIKDGSAKNRPPQLLFNHAFTGTSDGYQRRVLMETVFLRNFQQQ